jgi:hypothetical protein
MAKVSLDKLSTPAELSDWIREHREDRDGVQIVRVLTREVSRWFNNDLTPDQLRAITDNPPASTGDIGWDATLEGLVAYRLHCEGMPAPSWTARRKTAGGFDPFDGLVKDNRHYIMDVFHTPVELLNKGVVLPTSELRRWP